MEKLLKIYFTIGLRTSIKPLMRTTRLSYKIKRRLMELLAKSNPVAKQVSYSDFEVAGCKVRKVVPRQRQCEESALLYVHGGVFALGSFKTHASLVSHLVEFSGIDLYFPEYRLAPEASFPTPNTDIESVYNYLLASGIAAKNISIVSDSAGATLAVSAIMRLHAKQVALPGALVLISPWLDIECSGRDAICDKRDCMLSWGCLLQGAQLYAGANKLSDPEISTIHLSPAELAVLPRTLIHLGENEIILQESRDFYQKLIDAGVAAQIRVFAGMWHDFQLHGKLLTESRQSLMEIAHFVNARNFAAQPQDTTVQQA